MMPAACLKAEDTFDFLADWQFNANVEPYIHNYEWKQQTGAEGFTLFGLLTQLDVQTQLSSHSSLRIGALVMHAPIQNRCNRRLPHIYKKYYQVK